jgi:hypothetical protein
MDTQKIDSREVYGDDTVPCACNEQRACGSCMDDGLYGDAGQLPPPPPFILLDAPLTDEEARAMHTLMHCEDEQLCTFCNQ